MNANSKPYRMKGIVASLAAVAILTVPVFADKAAFAENTGQVAALSEGQFLIQPSATHPGYMLPPLSDHLLVAQLDEGRFARGKDHGNVASEADSTAQHERGSYQEPEQVGAFVLVPTTIEAVELANVSDRGNHNDPQMLVAYIMLPKEAHQ